MQKKSDCNEELWTAWESFCDRIKTAGKVAFRDNVPDTELERATGLRYISRYITKALNHELEFADPLHPQFYYLQTPTNKSFGDNPDCTYLDAVVHSDHIYKIVGNRGSVTWVSFKVGQAVLNNSDLNCNWDGSFEITIGGPRQDHNWLPLEGGLQRVFVRQFFGEWDLEEPMSVRMERVGEPTPPAPLTSERLSAGLQAAADWLEADSEYWLKWVDTYQETPNQFVPGVPAWTNPDGSYDGNTKLLGRALHFCGWQLEEDEALIITVKPPECAYWNFELSNSWMNSVDYRYRLSSLNCKQAAFQPDGSIVVVVAHKDPGVANWLDTGEHNCGLVIQRWVESVEKPSPKAKHIKFGDLDRSVPVDTPRIMPDVRREQLKRRKIGVDKRFGVWAG